MLTTPIVEGAYYEREDGQTVGPAIQDVSQGLWRIGPDLFWSNGLQLNQAHRLTRRVYIVPTDPADVVAELREIAAASYGEIPDGIPEAYNDAADLVAERLGVKS